ncbi:hypothetical protein M2277_001884 [Paenibacillus sp. LBL]|uniref:copper amine oxidase N-terminal domain-containing protein n=1 Tax=Paenibacillus sp. LBL TaxID=2940563 RepID=UPI00247646D1|nr:copper amine oxidase N-terminal domain-containing protein [Paenibacillus sp. LBL]MDH6671234.1 hypothetical protein [Paenibacillus sp. LBL]
MRRVKKSLAAILLSVNLFSLSGGIVLADGELYTPSGKQIILQIGNPYMLVNGERKQVDSETNTAPVSKNGITYLPLKSLIKELGGTIAYNSKTKKTIIKLDNEIIELTVGSRIAIINGVSNKINAAPINEKGRILIPLRVVSENMKLKLNWDQVNKEITLYHGGEDRWYEGNHVEKISPEYGVYTDQTIGYTVNYFLEWGTPLVIQKKNTIETVFYESKSARISSYSDFMQSIHDEEYGMILDESYEGFLERKDIIKSNSELSELSIPSADAAYLITNIDDVNAILYIVTFKEDQVGIFEISIDSQISPKETQDIEAFIELFLATFNLDSAVG